MARTRIPLLADDGGSGGGCDVDPVDLDMPEITDETQTNVLVFNVTMQCPLRCDFCCYGCHPKREERMALDLALSLVDQAAELGVFSAAGFTGGEPMLWFDELLVVGAALQEVGLPFSVVSAAHWAEDPSEARRVVDALVDRGMYRLGMSTDPSHARFVPPAAVVNAARAAADRGIEIQVVGAFNDPEMTIERFVPDIVGLPNLRVRTGYVAAAGRGAKLRDRVDKDLGYVRERMRCYRPAYHDLVIFSDGAAYPCCSVYNRDAEGITLGNANTDSLRTLWERAEGQLLLRVLKRVGFGHLYDVIAELDPALRARLPELDTAGGPCLLCKKVFGDVELARDIRNAFVAYEQRTVDALLASLQDEFGPAEAANIVRSAINATTTRS